MSIPISHEPLAAEGGCLVLRIRVDASFPDEDLKEATKHMGKAEIEWRRDIMGYNIVKIKTCKEEAPDPWEELTAIRKRYEPVPLAVPSYEWLDNFTKRTE